jgi:uncharacterized protein YbcC (UPF0753/DUF2309 family)
MTTITPAVDSAQDQIRHQISQSVNQALIKHQQELQLEREQIKCLTQLLSSCINFSPDEHCVVAIKRLTELLDRHQQASDRVCDVLNTLTQAKDAQDLTVNDQGEIVKRLELGLSELAQRLKIDHEHKLSAAIRNPLTWTKLMAAYADSDGYQWQFPHSKRGFYRRSNLVIVGTKKIPIEVAPSAALN